MPSRKSKNEKKVPKYLRERYTLIYEALGKLYGRELVSLLTGRKFRLCWRMLGAQGCCVKVKILECDKEDPREGLVFVDEEIPRRLFKDYGIEIARTKKIVSITELVEV